MLGHEPGAMLLLAVAQQALLQLDSFSPQELTNMVSCQHLQLHNRINPTYKEKGVGGSCNWRGPVTPCWTRPMKLL